MPTNSRENKIYSLSAVGFFQLQKEKYVVNTHVKNAESTNVNILEDNQI